MTMQEAPRGQDLLTELLSQDPRLRVVIVQAKDQLFITRYTLNGLSTPPVLAVLQKGLVVRLNFSFSEANQVGERGLVNEDSLKRLKEALQTDGPHVVFMRHGTQFSDKPDKIAIMHLPNNMNEPLTTQSMIQATATAVAIAEIARRTGKKIRVVSSENRRALQTAAVIAGAAKAATTATLEIDQRLNCVNYPPIDEMSEEELRSHLDAGGSLPWEEDTVNAICGAGTYQRIMEDMKQMLDETLVQDSNIITIVITHTPQTQAMDTLFWQQPNRLRELGMRVVSFGQNREIQTTLFPNGIFVS